MLGVTPPLFKVFVSMSIHTSHSLIDPSSTPCNASVAPFSCESVAWVYLVPSSYPLIIVYLILKKFSCIIWKIEYYTIITLFQISHFIPVAGWVYRVNNPSAALYYCPMFGTPGRLQGPTSYPEVHYQEILYMGSLQHKGICIPKRETYPSVGRCVSNRLEIRPCLP